VGKQLRLYPEVTKALSVIKKAHRFGEVEIGKALCNRYIVKDSDGRGYFVRIKGMDSPLYDTFDEAAEFIIKAVANDLIEGRRRAGVLDDEDKLNLPMPGVQAALDDPENNADPRLAKPKNKISLWDRHRESLAKRGRVNNAKREARIS